MVPTLHFPPTTSWNWGCERPRSLGGAFPAAQTLLAWRRCCFTRKGGESPRNARGFMGLVCVGCQWGCLGQQRSLSLPFLARLLEVSKEENSPVSSERFKGGWGLCLISSSCDKEFPPREASLTACHLEAFAPCRTMENDLKLNSIAVHWGEHVRVDGSWWPHMRPYGNISLGVTESGVVGGGSLPGQVGLDFFFFF